MFALCGQIFQGQFVTKIEQCTCVRNWVLRPTLMRAIMKEQSASKSQSKEDRNHGIKLVNENQYYGNLCSCTFNQPNKNGTCNNELQVCNVAHYLISTVSAVPPYPPWVNITNMQQTVLNFKKSTFGNKKCMFYWKTPKIKGRWRVKVYTLTYIYIY